MSDEGRPIDLDPLLLFPMYFSLDELKDMKRPPTRTIYEFPTWTPELRGRVAEYLMELSSEQYAALLSELEGEAPDGDRAAQVTYMTTDISPSSLASSVHHMAVKIVPTLECLIESELIFPGRPELGYEALGYWLGKNASEDQQSALIRALDPAGSTKPLSGRYSILDWIEDTKLSPFQIQQAWELITSETS